MLTPRSITSAIFILLCSPGSDSWSLLPFPAMRHLTHFHLVPLLMPSQSQPGSLFLLPVLNSHGRVCRCAGRNSYTICSRLSFPEGVFAASVQGFQKGVLGRRDRSSPAGSCDGVQSHWFCVPSGTALTYQPHNPFAARCLTERSRLSDGSPDVPECSPPDPPPPVFFRFLFLILGPSGNVVQAAHKSFSPPPRAYANMNEKERS